MNLIFWSNTIWYIGLGVIGVCELIFVMLNSQNRKFTFAFFITIFGISLNFETLICIFLKSYYCYPMIIKSPIATFDDNLAGNLFSRFSISTTLLLLVVLNLNYYWVFACALTYGLIEEAFLTLGIYTHNWYQTWITIVAFPLFFWVAKKIYIKISRTIKPMLYYCYIFFGLFALYVVTILWGFMLSGHLSFYTPLIKDFIRSRYFLCLVIFFIPQSFSMMFIYFSKLKWIWNVMFIIGLFILNYVCSKLNLVIFDKGWFLIISIICFSWMYLSILLLDKLYGGVEKNCEIKYIRLRGDN